MPVTLIADSGSTKCEWCLLADDKKKKIITQGISPYFISQEQLADILKKELLRKINAEVSEIFYYGTGLGNPENVRFMKRALKKKIFHLQQLKRILTCLQQPGRYAGIIKALRVFWVPALIPAITTEKKL